MMKKTFLLCVAATLAVSAARGEEARLLRFPATNGEDVTFSYAGDLYRVPLTGGRAQRLTSHVGVEIFPHYSPDGSKIAFTGQYDGNTEVYLMPAVGGEPQRLTYTATNDRDDLGDRMGPNNIVLNWTPDGHHVVYRNRISDGFSGKMWQVSDQGGMPEALPLPEGGFCSYSPDGKKMAYNRTMREFRTWKYYKGGMADDIWIYDPEASSVTNITNNDAQDIFPMWIGDDIYFISDRHRTMNIYAYNTVSGETRQVTNFTDYDVKFPSSNGSIIVFENGGYIYSYNPATGKTTKIDVELDADNVYARTELKHVGDRVRTASLSPDAKHIAATARGEVFDVPTSKGATLNITRTSGGNERGAVWSPDGKSIAYIGDVTGETEIWLRDVESGETRQLTHDNDTYIRQLTWTPDSRVILYTDRRNRLMEVNPLTGAVKTLLENPEAEFRSISVSPDSRWLAYTRPASNNMDVVYIFDRNSGKEYAVTEHWYDSSSPEFSTDGRYLVFTSARDFNPTYGSLEWNHVYNRLGGVYLALLSSETPSPLIADQGVEAPATSEINPEGLPGRLVKLPLPAGNYSGFFSDGKRVWYHTNGAIKNFDLKSQKETVAAEGASLADVLTDGSKGLVRKGGKLYVVDMSAPKLTLDDAVDTSDMVAMVDYPEEWAQIFDEVWRAYRDGFYLENMHGVDWPAIKEKYAALLPYAKTRLDLNYIIGEMISELACGHAYVNPGEKPEPQRISMGLLGAELSRDAATGAYRVDRILPGAIYSESLRSPLAEPGIDVAEGCYIQAVDGVPASSTTNIYSLLVGKAGVYTALTVSDDAKGAKNRRQVVVKPIDNEYPLYHLEWVQGNIKRVDEATNGRVGYVYIPDMGPEGLNEFARYFYPQLDKEALIVDDRANGGGNVSPMILERLLREPYRMTMSRTSTKTNTIPDATLAGPKVLLINKYSASDGDLFPWSFKATGAGKVIGTRSWGGIVGISGSLPYIDGTDVRVPFFTNYDVKTGEWIVENHGVDPDIWIDNDPIAEHNGIDQQLEKAIEVILQELENRTPLPPVPAPRTFKDLGVEE